MEGTGKGIWPIILLGPRGSGKSSVGRLLADRQGARLVDLDEVIVAKAGLSIAKIFAAEGEEGFRGRESAALREVLGSGFSEGGVALVVSTGGGVVEREENRRLLVMAGGSRLLLLACAEELCRRVEADAASSESRPPLSDVDPLTEMGQVLARRLPLWREVATHELDTTSLAPEQVAERAIESLGVSR